MSQELSNKTRISEDLTRLFGELADLVDSNLRRMKIPAPQLNSSKGLDIGALKNHIKILFSQMEERGQRSPTPAENSRAHDLEPRTISIKQLRENNSTRLLERQSDTNISQSAFFGSASGPFKVPSATWTRVEAPLNSARSISQFNASN